MNLHDFSPAASSALWGFGLSLSLSLHLSLTSSPLAPCWRGMSSPPVWKEREREREEGELTHAVSTHTHTHTCICTVQEKPHDDSHRGTGCPGNSIPLPSTPIPSLPRSCGSPDSPSGFCVNSDERQEVKKKQPFTSCALSAQRYFLFLALRREPELAK